MENKKSKKTKTTNIANNTVLARQKSKKAEFLKDYNHTGGIIVSCRKLHISPNSIKKWRNLDEKFNRKCNEIEEYFIDRVECRAFDLAINKGNVAMIQFLLRHRLPKKYSDDKTQNEDKRTVVLNFSKDEEQY